MRGDDEQLEEMIRAAFRRLPEPDAARLKAVETRLLRRHSRAPRQARSRYAYAWLVLGLAATGAAAWWVGGYVSRDVPRPGAEQRVAPNSTAPDAPERPAEQPKEPSDGDAGAKQDSPKIYRREMY